MTIQQEAYPIGFVPVSSECLDQVIGLSRAANTDKSIEADVARLHRAAVRRNS